MVKTWWKESVVYQIYPRSFMDSNGDGIGDLNGIITRLDYLKELGINVIWMSPVYKSPNDDNGYDISDYKDIMDDFGTMEDFERLLSEAHKRDIKIVMDLVVNHSSDEHAWFVESRSSKDNPKRDYYIWREGKDGKEPNNWGSAFSGSAWEYDKTTDMYYLHCFSKKQVDLNWDNKEVREEIYSMMRWWCDKGIDGFRMDVISMISKPDGLPDGPIGEGELYANCGITCNGPRVHEYLQEMNREVLSKYDLLTVGETAGVTLEEAVKYANEDGSELSMVFQFDHMGLDYDPVTGKFCKQPGKIRIKALKETLTKWQQKLEGKAWNSLYFCNHDQPRIVSRMGDNSPLAAKAIATLNHMMKGTPYVYQGEELGMTNCPFKSIDDYRDIEAKNAYKENIEEGLLTEEEVMNCLSLWGRDHARTPMQWDDSYCAGFTTGTPWIMVNPAYKEINAKKQLTDDNSVFAYYKKLIELRRSSDYKDIIVYGTYELISPEDENIYAYLRHYEDRTMIVICNLSAEEIVYNIPDEINIQSAKCLIANYQNTECRRDMKLAPWQSGVWIL